jgi:hypothetical protein
MQVCWQSVVSILKHFRLFYLTGPYSRPAAQHDLYIVFTYKCGSKNIKLATLAAHWNNLECPSCFCSKRISWSDELVVERADCCTVPLTSQPSKKWTSYLSCERKLDKSGAGLLITKFREKHKNLVSIRTDCYATTVKLSQCTVFSLCPTVKITSIPMAMSDVGREPPVVWDTRQWWLFAARSKRCLCFPFFRL